ncbi:SH3 domain-containing protein [Aurantimonas sp. HBX-1]|uniref:SH3 domain-containing protein n=1 Tax=Aurantimonas sp. HBX-1 TaxID=2906072 RepID=UPI001F199476|nr:SH3 domain-containing protein [Aurantimonas sp. HBX-1]UIJ72711.1 SH3 domain-containing protein [Aurantimonas sp. HBX-1]
MRPTEEVLRQRLIARRSDYERARGETGPGGRLNGRGTANLWVPGAAPAGGRLRRFLMRRPVTAYLSMATVAGLLFGGLALALSGSGADVPSPVRTAAVQPEESWSSPARQATAVTEKTELPVAAIGAEAASGNPAVSRPDPAVTAPVPARTAEPAARLRPASNILPATGPAEGTVITDEAAAALALRLPPADATLAMTDVPDRLLTTGSVPPEGGATGAGPAQGAEEAASGSGETAETAGTPAPDGPKADAVPAEEEVAALAEPEAAKRTATVNASVNMRARPDNDASILAVLPRGSAVEIIDCDQWCEVAASGTRGFVFKRFVDDADG